MASFASMFPPSYKAAVAGRYTFTTGLEALKEEVASSTDYSALNRKFHDMEQEAVEQGSSGLEFFVIRATYFDKRAQSETNTTRKAVFIRNALRDYHKVLEVDPDMEGIVERVEALQGSTSTAGADSSIARGGAGYEGNKETHP